MTSVAPVYIGNVPVGDGYPTAFAAEFSTFFNTDTAKALAYIERAAEAGVDIIKSEVLHNPEVCLPTDLVHRYHHATGTASENYRKLVERKVLPLASYRKIYTACHDLGMPFIASVYDTEGIDFLVDVGVAGIKVTRDNINNIPLIRYAAQTQLPLVFDAGATYIDELARAVRTVRATGNDQIIINYHPAMNPASGEAHDMRLVRLYKEMFQLPTGLACHYQGNTMIYLAVGCGANLIEKGVDDNPQRQEQDVVSAVSFEGLPALLSELRACSAAMQPGGIDLSTRDESTRRCLVTSKAVAVGESLTLDNTRFAWPPLGISVEHWDIVANGTASRDLPPHHVLRWEDVKLTDEAVKRS